MKLPLFPKNEKYVNIIITIFAILSSIFIIGRVANDRYNLSVAVYFETDESILFYSGKEKIDDKVKLVIPVQGIEISLEEFLKKIGDRYVGIMEFYGDTKFVQDFYRATGYRKIVKVHYVKPQELAKYNSYTLFKRLWRSVMERSINVIVLPEGQISTEALSEFKKFFQVQSNIPEPDTTNWRNRIFGLMLGIYVILQAPIGVILFLLFNNYWLFVSVISIFGTITAYFTSQNRFTKVANVFILGILTNFALYSFEYLNDLEVYRGVKISLIILPLIVALITFRDLYKEKSIKKWHIITTGIVGIAAVGYMLLRSGNYGYVLDFEEKLRIMLENMFIIRPRIKELLFLPMFFIAENVENKFLSGILTFFGTFGFVSIFNSFCHLKAPIYIVFYREVTTILVAIVIYLILNIFKNLFMVWTNKK
ncbi:MAG: DUF5693 family protein [Fervidobacterium sp.]|uniref:DUF5693 family protein n=1 Tax=Fervidobacterium sp. TaxID=1871331 RepID=UPI00404B742F